MSVKLLVNDVVETLEGPLAEWQPMPLRLQH